MSDIAIKCEGLSKQYRIGERESYKALRDVIADVATAPFRRIAQRARRNGQSVLEQGAKSEVQTGPTSDLRPPTSDLSPSALSPLPSAPGTFWALDDVSFEVKRGEVIGIIGRNGAGKSTLLKILSRITKPTRGHAEIHGRVGSLLEVGTGFHPELTGRENIYLNGAILGMRKAEIDRKFDEIVAFAEVEKFLDTPVKRYSSGMYIRLAFAVAAHLEPETLMIDEVLAVGDSAFQKKCLGKMDAVARHGRTVLFVSHNMAMIQRLCPTSLLLDRGQKLFHGPSDECVRRYAGKSHDNTSTPAKTSTDGTFAIESIHVLDRWGTPTSIWQYGHDLIVQIEVRVNHSCARLAVDISFYTVEGQRLFGLNSEHWSGKKSFDSGSHWLTFHIQNPGITAPEIYLDVGLRTAGAGYDILLQYAAFLSVPLDTLPAHTLPQDPLTPAAEVSWG